MAESSLAESNFIESDDLHESDLKKASVRLLENVISDKMPGQGRVDSMGRSASKALAGALSGFKPLEQPAEAQDIRIAPVPRERFVDPFVQPIDEALSMGDREEAVRRADLLLEDSAKKYGKNSTNYMYSAYKIAQIFDPRSAGFIELRRNFPPYSLEPKLAKPYWQEVIDTANRVYGNEAKRMSMVGDAYLGLANGVTGENMDAEKRYLEQAVDINENILKKVQRENPPNISPHNLEMLINCNLFLESISIKRHETARAEMYQQKYMKFVKMKHELKQ